MKKYWVNENIQSIENAFESYRKVSFCKSDVSWNEPDDYAKIEKGSFEYCFITSRISRSSWSDDEDYESMDEFNQEHFDSALAFVLSVVVPRLKKTHIRKLVSVISKHMKYGSGGYRSDYYTSYGYDAKTITFEKIFEVTKSFLKENELFREKDDFVKI